MTYVYTTDSCDLSRKSACSCILETQRGRMNGVGDLFRRIEGDGWLVVADRLPSMEGEFAALGERVINHVDISYSPFCIFVDEEIEPSTSAFIDDIDALFGVSVERLRLSEAQYVETAQPGLYILSGGTESDWINVLGTSLFGEALKKALLEGALIIAVNAAASALGSWVLEREGPSAVEGLNWLPGAIVLPWLDDPANSDHVRSLLSLNDQLYALGIADGKMFAFGPEGQVEIWGNDAPTLVLGVGWR